MTASGKRGLLEIPLERWIRLAQMASVIRQNEVQGRANAKRLVRTAARALARRAGLRSERQATLPRMSAANAREMIRNQQKRRYPKSTLAVQKAARGTMM